LGFVIIKFVQLCVDIEVNAVFNRVIATAENSMPHEMTLDPKEAPAGFYAVLKSEAKPSDGSNICRACDWRHECQNHETDLLAFGHRCMSDAVVAIKDGKTYQRADGCSVLFKKKPLEVPL
jgi:hypothetical protein